MKVSVLKAREVDMFENKPKYVLTACSLDNIEVAYKLAEKYWNLAEEYNLCIELTLETFDEEGIPVEYATYEPKEKEFKIIMTKD